MNNPILILSVSSVLGNSEEKGLISGLNTKTKCVVNQVAVGTKCCDCRKELKQVCGKDGVTYDNAC